VDVADDPEVLLMLQRNFGRNLPVHFGAVSPGACRLIHAVCPDHVLQNSFGKFPVGAENVSHRLRQNIS